MHRCCRRHGRGQRLAFDVLDGLVVHRHQAGAGTGLDGHVAHRHAAFHAERAYGRAAEFDGVAGAAAVPILPMMAQHDVLGAATLGQAAFHLDQQVLGLLGQQRLRGHHVFPPRWCLCRAPARRRRRGWRCANHRTPPSCPARWRRSPGLSRARCPGVWTGRGSRPQRRTPPCCCPAWSPVPCWWGRRCRRSRVPSRWWACCGRRWRRWS